MVTNRVAPATQNYGNRTIGPFVFGPFYLVLWCARAMVGDNDILTGVRVTYYYLVRPPNWGHFI